MSLSHSTYRRLDDRELWCSLLTDVLDFRRGVNLQNAVARCGRLILAKRCPQSRKIVENIIFSEFFGFFLAVEKVCLNDELTVGLQISNFYYFFRFCNWFFPFFPRPCIGWHLPIWLFNYSKFAQECFFKRDSFSSTKNRESQISLNPFLIALFRKIPIRPCSRPALRVRILFDRKGHFRIAGRNNRFKVHFILLRSRFTT